MKPIIPDFDNASGSPLYIQLYNYLKKEITEGRISKGEKLPSLRTLAKNLSISITTVEMAYNQLLVEGYVKSKPQSGYYTTSINAESKSKPGFSSTPLDFDTYPFTKAKYKYDTGSFDFIKWKKCLAKVLNEHADLLLFESDPQGEKVLRHEISGYLYSSRGVKCTPDQVVIAAGTQQLTNHLARIMRKMNISHVSTEDPGYMPLQNIFRDMGFTVTKIPVHSDGINIEKIPVNIPSAVYVSPSSQFPTGAVMPIGRRYRLLDWAMKNHSIILEDDYDSELRYFGKPVPALQGLDRSDSVVYLGSFSSTLFPAIKISYMVLPNHIVDIFQKIKNDYDQTCSKEEQLALAMFMEKGYYTTNIKKLRNLYARKLQNVLAAFNKYGKNFVTPQNTSSGINIIINVKTEKNTNLLCQLAATLSVKVMPMSSLIQEDRAELIFYYNQIPLDEIDKTIKDLILLWTK